MLKLKMMLCVMMLPLVVVVCGCTSKQSVISAKPPPPGVDNAASSRLADTAERDYFTPESDHYAKQLKELRSILMSSADRVAYIDGQLMQLL